MSFAKNIGKNLSNKYGQQFLDSAKKSTTDAIKTASKRAIQKRAKAAGDLVGNKIADKISAFKTSPTELHSAELCYKKLQNDEMEAPKKDTYLQKKGNKFLVN